MTDLTLPEGVAAIASERVQKLPQPVDPARDAGTEPLLNDQAYDRIKHDIISCILPPGSGISESQL
ncbi:MAG: hypothetical protein WCS09_01720, partial [Pseudomonadota bacterium]